MGDITLRVWPVAHLVLLWTTEPEAERALVSLLGHPDPAVRRATAERLEELRVTAAAA